MDKDKYIKELEESRDMYFHKYLEMQSKYNELLLKVKDQLIEENKAIRERM